MCQKKNIKILIFVFFSHVYIRLLDQRFPQFYVQVKYKILFLKIEKINMIVIIIGDNKYINNFRNFDTNNIFRVLLYKKFFFTLF